MSGIFQRGFRSCDDNLVVVDHYAGHQQSNIGTTHGPVFGNDPCAECFPQPLDRLVGDLARGAAELSGQATLGLAQGGDRCIGLSELRGKDRIAHAHHSLFDDLEQSAEPRIRSDPFTADPVEVLRAALSGVVGAVENIRKKLAQAVGREHAVEETVQHDAVERILPNRLASTRIRAGRRFPIVHVTSVLPTLTASDDHAGVAFWMPAGRKASE
ncbi:hypothetical protein [uncultured Sphingomonas sp.]|uniref:hypothetical protein n=1 Tax=uncultured Sphingomonas sp. TaxID=158754 RepID=UPI0035C959B4